MKKESFASPRAFSAPNRFSQVVKYGDVAFISGQVAADIDGKALGGSIKEQSKVVLGTIKNILEDMNLGLNSILMMRCYVSDINEIAQMNEVYEEYFKDVEILPARCTVEANMGNFDVEMYAIVGLK